MAGNFAALWSIDSKFLSLKDLNLLKKVRSLNAENLGYVGQRAAKLQAIKVWEWFNSGHSQMRADWFECGQGWKADFFFRPPTLMAGNFAALPTDPKFLSLKDLNLLKKHTKNQEASSILRVCFSLSKCPPLHGVYLVWVRHWFSETV